MTAGAGSGSGPAVVTGAARGIGRAVAERLGAEGRTVLLVDVAEAVEGTAAELRAAGVDAVAVVADLVDDAGVAAVVAAAGSLDRRPAVLVNAAGITRDQLLGGMTGEEFAAVIRVNLGTAYRLTLAIEPLLADGGAVVQISSRSWLGNVGQFNYAMSKGGLVGLTRALALAWAPRIRVNAVAPGLTATQMTLDMPERVRDRLVDATPMGRMAEPAEVAAVVTALAGDAFGYVTGQVLPICGGRSL